MVEPKRFEKFLKEKWSDVIFFIVFFVLLIGQVQVTLGKPVSLVALVAVESNSMVPTFERGDILLVWKGDQVKKGEVILFKADTKAPIVHRVVEIVNQEGCSPCFITKGDNNPTDDRDRMGLIGKDQLLAEVVSVNGYIFKVPKLGYLSLWIRGR